MKKRMIGIVLAAACLAGSTQVFAAGGGERSLVSVSYLETSFLPGLTETIRSWVEESTQAACDAAQERLEQLGREYLSGLSGNQPAWSYCDTAQVHNLKRGDVITLATGSTVLWRAGSAAAAVGLIDATAGSELSDGGRLTVGHRYLSGAEEGAVTVTVLSDAAQLLLAGYWSVAESEEQVTGFTDLIQETDWFYDGVYYVVERGLFNGVSDTAFSPNTTMNRSMLAAVLYRLAGSPQIAYDGEFDDVPAEQWYAQSVGWAAQAGVVKGLGEGRFGPADDVTREQIATMLYRYAKDYLGMDVSHTGDLSGYRDLVQVSDWAREGMLWAVGAGIITGTEDNQLMPGSNANRAQVAVMLQRFEAWAA